MNGVVVQNGPRPLTIDLRGKTPDEVVEILIDNGFGDIQCVETGGWKNRSILHIPTEEDKERVVHLIQIKEDEASNLTVISFSGKVHVLRPGHDLHFFEGPNGGWGWARTSYLFK